MERDIKKGILKSKQISANNEASPSRYEGTVMKGSSKIINRGIRFIKKIHQKGAEYWPKIKATR